MPSQDGRPSRRKKQTREEMAPITLADIGGLEDVKRRLEVSFVGPMRSAELRALFRISLRGGMLLWGPPGCGKTMIARAVAGELGAHLVNVGINDVLSMWLGNSEKNIHEIFETARDMAPALLFFDELDALGHKRTGFANTSGRNVVAQLLVEMEGVAADNDGVYMLAATNQPWAIDPALRRPGRFDRSILVLPPDGPARLAILQYHLRERPVAALDLREIVEATDGFSGADLELVCREAAELAMADSLRSGSVRPIDGIDLLDAMTGVRPSTGAWMELARSFAADGESSGDYDDLLEYLRVHAEGGPRSPDTTSDERLCPRCGRPMAVTRGG